MYTRQVVINNFKDVPEPEFQDSVILEQYQANVSGIWSLFCVFFCSVYKLRPKMTLIY